MSCRISTHGKSDANVCKCHASLPSRLGMLYLCAGPAPQFSAHAASWIQACPVTRMGTQPCSLQMAAGEQLLPQFRLTKCSALLILQLLQDKGHQVTIRDSGCSSSLCHCLPAWCGWCLSLTSWSLQPQHFAACRSPGLWLHGALMFEGKSCRCSWCAWSCHAFRAIFRNPGQGFVEAATERT